LEQFLSNKKFVQNLAFLMVDTALFPRKLFYDICIKFYVGPGPNSVPDPEPESEYIKVPVLVPLKQKVEDPSVPVLATVPQHCCRDPKIS
jgi:hypothetical protein